ncbi:hypothetical protein HOP52_04150 [Halomonas campisalis]|uniref:Uncharacterized protein n=1 Tax=Billgrantia campisalis TaxID=74661 RepID=A0ABS9P780_9GAMM|nr:hypothetical protein [Halomonas campisalis]MCG6656970.1 hypothetical protein [Halomonas campisalis]MDR5862158.1 hypothetical protein [Halomonas campisalis]
MSRSASILAHLQQATLGAKPFREALVRAALEADAAGLAYRPSDIDLLAIEALGYPRHLGGPHYQASADITNRENRH